MNYKNETFSGMLYGKHITLKRISKKEARRRFNDGETIYLQSCNFHPFGVWSQAYPIGKTDPRLTLLYDDDANMFDPIVDGFEYYNCSYEQGYYSSYYIKS